MQTHYDRLVKINAEKPCINVIKTAAVQLREELEGFPLVHGRCDLLTCMRKDLHIDFPTILKGIQEIDHLTPPNLLN